MARTSALYPYLFKQSFCFINKLREILIKNLFSFFYIIHTTPTSAIWLNSLVLWPNLTKSNLGPNHYRVVPLDVIKPRAPQYTFRIKFKVILIKTPGNKLQISVLHYIFVLFYFFSVKCFVFLCFMYSKNLSYKQIL